jgi:hypothetical protein
VPQVGQTRCGRFGWPHVGQTFTFGALIACVARRLSRRDFEVFRFGTAMTGGHYSGNAARRSARSAAAASATPAKTNDADSW